MTNRSRRGLSEKSTQFGDIVFRSGVIRRVAIVISPIRGPITLRITTHEPPSRVFSGLGWFFWSQNMVVGFGVGFLVVSGFEKGFYKGSLWVLGSELWVLVCSCFQLFTDSVDVVLLAVNSTFHFLGFS